jgi:hypothetical protein
MLRALLAHLQEALHKQQLVYWMPIISAGCWSSSQQTYACNIKIVYAAPPEDEQVVLETCRGC